jgi:hypothetical protein
LRTIYVIGIFCTWGGGEWSGVEEEELQHHEDGQRRLHALANGEWSEFADERIALLTLIE